MQGNDTPENARLFLNQIFTSAKFELEVGLVQSSSNCTLNIVGGDTHLLRIEGGELLDALELLVNQAFSLNTPTRQYFVCDVEGYRGVRETELRAMARHAADLVLSSGIPYTFGPMSANERRIIHLALANDEKLFTESIGEGNLRRLRVNRRIPS